ncbi:alpha/beta fold hydrolase [Nonomuraea rubra]|uniref:alpha/beta fold hydrolase n=1 Tax=Nonomuraea rubra TaxID=46180 RepID=UPI0034075AE9
MTTATWHGSMPSTGMVARSSRSVLRRSPVTRGSRATSSGLTDSLPGARAVELDGLGHWWMLQDPARAARVLSEFWNGLES